MSKELLDDALSVLREAEKVGARLSFSGGADSTIMHHLIQHNNINIDKIFTSMGVENPHNVKIIREVITHYSDVVKAKPKKSYKQLVYDYGFPIKNKEFSDKAWKIRKMVTGNYMEEHGTWRTVMYSLTNIAFAKLSSDTFTIDNYDNYLNKILDPRYYHLILNYPIQNQCCNVLKKHPSKQVGDYPIIGIMKSDSRIRKQMIEENFNSNDKKAFYPLRNWTKDDVMEYAGMFDDCDLSKSYTEREVDGTVLLPTSGTGCMGCHYGNTVNHKKVVDGVEVKTTKLDILSIEFPKQYKQITEMQSHDGHTYGEVVKIAEDCLQWKYYKQSRKEIKPIIKRVICCMKNDGFTLEAKRFKMIMKHILADNKAKYKRMNK